MKHFCAQTVCEHELYKQLKPYSLMMSLYLYFHLLHLILGLKIKIYYTVAHVPDYEYSVVGSSLFY